MNLRSMLAAETLGTFMLVFAGCGAVVVNDLHGGVIGHAGIAMAFGLAVMTGIYAVGEVSGAHFNPAITIGFWLGKRFDGHFVVPFIAAQTAGSVTAALLLRLLMPAHEGYGVTLPMAGLWQAFVMEIVLTFWLAFVIFTVSTGAKEKGFFAGIAIGGTVTLAALFGGPLSGASMNPARSFGPALVSGIWVDLWVYLSAPVIGSALAVAACRLVRGDDCCQDEGQA